MKPYKNLSGDSGVVAYDIGEEHIDVQFRHGEAYRYDYPSAGAEHIENMKLLARAGRGLSTYISRYVKDRYGSKL